MCVLCVAGHKRVTSLVAQEVPWEVLHGFPEAIAGPVQQSPGGRGAKVVHPVASVGGGVTPKGTGGEAWTRQRSVWQGRGSAARGAGRLCLRGSSADPGPRPRSSHPGFSRQEGPQRKGGAVKGGEVRTGSAQSHGCGGPAPHREQGMWDSPCEETRSLPGRSRRFLQPGESWGAAAVPAQ